MCTWTCRPSSAASRRRRASAGHEPDDRLLDQPVHPAGPDPVRERRDLRVHEPRRRGLRAMVARAIRRARHAGRSPARPAPRSAGAGAAARGPHRGRPCRSRWAARPRPRTRPHRTPRPAARRVRRPGPGGRRSRSRVHDRLRRMQVRPRASRPEQVGLGGVRSGAAVPGSRAPRQRCPLRCRGWWRSRDHGPILVAHVFESSVESVDISIEIRRSEGSPRGSVSRRAPGAL